MRTDAAHQHDDLEHRLHVTFEAVLSALVPDHTAPAKSLQASDDEMVEFISLEPFPRAGHPRRLSGRVLSIAAAVLIGLFATVFAVNRRHPTTSPTLATLPAGTAGTMILQPLPDDLTMTTPAPRVSTRTQPSAYVVHLYGSTNDPGDPDRMIRIEYANSQQTSGCRAASPITISDNTGSVCDVGGAITISWTIPSAGISASATLGRNVGVDDARGVLDSLTVRPRADSTADGSRGGPTADLVGDSLPVGWLPLLYDDVPFTQHVTESTWIASPGGQDNSAHYLLVSTWTGLDDNQAIYARQQPILAQRITVRGHPGYQYVSPQRGQRGPLQISIWWEEQPGTVVDVESTDLYESDALFALINRLQPIGTASLGVIH